jgi:tetratricopeptide (TPR) repeat protein
MSAPPAHVPDSVSGWLQHGQHLEAGGALAPAIDAYNRAVASAREEAERTPNDPSARRTLAVAWMNRGNAFQKLGAEHAHHQRTREHEETTRAAVADYDDAIASLGTLSLSAEPAFRNHLGAAWLNRGHALLGLAELKPAVKSFETAIEVLQTLPLNDDLSYRLNLAGAQTNLSHVLLQGTAAESAASNFSAVHAAAAARSALATLVGFETAHVLFAEMSLRARRALVIALGEQLVASESARQPIAALASEASDILDDGLTLAREAEERGASHLRPLAARLFRMGAQLYGTHQPHFLAEFLLENVDPGEPRAVFAHDSDFRAAADEALARTLAALNRPNLLISGTRDAERLVATARSLRAVQLRLSTPNPPRSISVS